jgi:hypothetical protein
MPGDSEAFPGCVVASALAAGGIAASPANVIAATNPRPNLLSMVTLYDSCLLDS